MRPPPWRSNNMLYPEEDREQKRLIYVCKFCFHKEPADDPCVSRTVIKHTAEYGPVVAGAPRPTCAHAAAPPPRRECGRLPASPHTRRERTTIVTDLAFDPTLPRSNEHECPRCHQSNVIYFQASSSDDSGMELFFVCQVPECGNRWKSNAPKEA